MPCMRPAKARTHLHSKDAGWTTGNAAIAIAIAAPPPPTPRPPCIALLCAQVDLPTPPPHSLALGIAGAAPLLLPDGPSFAPPSLPSYGAFSLSNQPVPLRRTRSGSRLVPIDGAPPSTSGGNVTFSVDVEKATGSSAGASGLGMPSLQRTNTSFFKDLVDSSLFSPGSREMFQAWADSPREAHQVAYDQSAPPALRHVASQEGLAEPPKMTRSVASYLRDISEEGIGSSPLVPSGSAELHLRAPAAPPLLSSGRQPSISRQGSLGLGLDSNPMPSLGGRTVTSFLQNFIDESATLESAPPPSAVPPTLRSGPSFSELADLPGIGESSSDTLSAIPPSLTAQISRDFNRRSSPRGSPGRFG